MQFLESTDILHKHKLISALEDLCKRDVLIYGVGTFADYLYKWLIKMGVKPIGFLVDTAYLMASEHLGLPVSAIDSYFEGKIPAQQKPIVIVSFINYDEKRFIPYSTYADVLCCDLQGMFVLGEYNYMDRQYLLNHKSDLLWLDA